MPPLPPNQPPPTKLWVYWSRLGLKIYQITDLRAAQAFVQDLNYKSGTLAFLSSQGVPTHDRP